MADERGMFPVSVGVLLTRTSDVAVLLGRRRNTGYADGMLSVPAGYVQPGETFTYAATRELWEETGLMLPRPALSLGATVWRRDHQVYLLFAADESDCTGKLSNREPEKCEGWDWFPSPLPTWDMPGFLALAIECVLSGGSYSEVPPEWDLHIPHIYANRRS